MRRLFSPLLLALITANIYAQEKLKLLKEIDLACCAGSAEVLNYREAGDLVYFTAANIMYGRELWKTDGTVEGTVLVKDIIAGPTGSLPGNLTVAGSLLYFTVSDGSLWVTDGSAEGTAQLSTFTVDRMIGSVNNQLIFAATQPGSGSELWMSDGTAEGTVMKEISPGNASALIGEFTEIFNNHLYFSANDGVHGQELWKTDGTIAGTVMVSDISSSTSTLGRLAATSNTLFFVYNYPGIGEELWRTDGTNTILVKDISTGAASTVFGSFTSLEHVLYFSADDHLSGMELYRSDGTTDGTYRIKDIQSGSGSSSPSAFITDAEHRAIYFTAGTVSSGKELWKTDGTASGTAMVKDIAPGYKDGVFNENRVLFKGHLYFIGYDQHNHPRVWRSDGTSAGTSIAYSDPEHYYVSQYTDFKIAGDRLFFLNGYSEISASGAELAFTDGTNTGFISVHAVKDVHAPAAALKNGKLAFTTRFGNTSWTYVTDGTNEGTIRIDYINKGTSTSAGAALFNVNGALVFRGHSTMLEPGLWKTDGTTAGTVKIMSEAWQSFVFNLGSAKTLGNHLYFNANTTQHGGEMWRTDGTTEGTSLFLDINTSGSSEPQYLLVHNGILYFWATTAQAGRELWRTNGTVEGTFMLKDILPGTGSTVFGLVPFAVGDLVYFRATSPDYGSELWRTDGTVDGTYMVLDINPGGDSNVSEIGIWNGLIFFRANDGTHGNELWRTDGTAAGTEMMKDIEVGSQSGLDLHGSASLQDGYYFGAFDMDHGVELWISKGTPETTTLVKDLNPGYPFSNALVVGAISGIPIVSTTGGLWTTNGTEAGTVFVKNAGQPSGSFLPLANKLLFRSNNTSTGTELWMTDGTADGTYMLQDIFPGISGSNPRNFSKIGGYYYFLADDPVSGTELWRSDGTICGTRKLTDDPETMIISPFIEYNNKLLFYANSLRHGLELFYYDLQTPVGSGCIQDQTITFEPPPATNYGANEVVLTYSISSGLPAALSSSNPDVIFIEGSSALVRGAGEAIITISQKGNLDFSSASPVRRRITVEKIELTVSARATKTYGDPLTGDMALFEGFMKGDSKDDLDIYPQPVHSVNEATVTGTYPLTFQGGADQNYTFVYEPGTIEVTPAPLTISAVAVTRKYGESNPVLGYVVTGYKRNEDASSFTQLPTVSTAATTFSNVGSYEINVEGGTATNYDINRVPAVLQIEKANQAITFNEILPQTLGVHPLELSAVSSVGLPIEFHSGSDHVTIADLHATLVKSGGARIEARQAGTPNYNAASVTREFCINPMKPVISSEGKSLFVTPYHDHETVIWFKDNERLIEQQSASFQATSDGTYHAQVNAGGCRGALSDPMELIVTGIEENNTDFSCYPNPTHERVLLQTSTKAKEIRVYSNSGKQVSADVHKTAENAFVVRFSELPPGLYMLVIILQNGHSVMSKVSVQK